MAEKHVLQHENLTVYRKVKLFGKYAYVNSDAFTDFGYYETREACLGGGAWPPTEPENVVRHEGIIDVCAVSGKKCFSGAKLSNGGKFAVEFAYSASEIKFKLYKGGSCTGSLLNPLLEEITFVGQKRADFASGKCVDATVAGFTRWGKLEIRSFCDPKEVEAETADGGRDDGGDDHDAAGKDEETMGEGGKNDEESTQDGEANEGTKPPQGD
eukprot:CAMPEP_0176046952 /NCGR_PEP_ID=MMETSP0120_2-20121206/23316_1 /TAXON_ID=160619 /ORGANISM="Kryptoperidinium foliaceum, Strain CCMP 1326" /LENGTH=212 /DNA_ID=CAMNT_0017380365 /DNA_START=110 /DNA_END=746 /DNA_ORIENTATION=-